jgi:hypothetical protein
VGSKLVQLVWWQLGLSSAKVHGISEKMFSHDLETKEVFQTEKRRV